MRPFFVASLLLALSACGNAFSAAQDADTIEAYEQFLAENPDSTWTLQARTRLDELRFQAAEANPSLEAWDAVLAQVPEGGVHDRAMAARETFLFDWAETTDTPESWQAFLDAYPKADKKRLTQARRAVTVAAYRDHLEIGPVAVAQVNLADDPKGPLNGWGFTADVTNRGEATLARLNLVLSLQDGSGKVLRRDEWPLVAPDFGIPMEEEKKQPMKPGETRTWTWSTGEVPEGFTDQVSLRPSWVLFVTP